MTKRFRDTSILAVVLWPFLLAAGCSENSTVNPPAPSPSPSPTPTASPTPTPAVPQFSHVAVLLLENAGYSDVIGNTSVMPYLNGLAASGGSASNYYGNFHPSIGNYFMITTGTGVTNDDAFNQVVAVDNLVRRMAASGVSWKSYQEDIPSAGYLGGNQGKYLKRHNPFAYFSDVVNNPAEAAKIVPFTQLALDRAANQLPQFIFITPNAVNDAHDCPPAIPNCTINDKLAVADHWLQQNIAPLLADPNFASNGLLVITLDEARNSDSTHGGGHIAFVVAGARVKPGYTSATFFQHQSLLRLICETLRIGAIPGAGASAAGMEEFFQ